MTIFDFDAESVILSTGKCSEQRIARLIDACSEFSTAACIGVNLGNQAAVRSQDSFGVSIRINLKQACRIIVDMPAPEDSIRLPK